MMNILEREGCTDSSDLSYESLNCLEVYRSMKKLNVLFSPPDIPEEEIAEVVDTLKSGWITTGPKTKLFEKQLAEFCHTN